MDIEHPGISKTLKEGYPDGAGKPQHKNTNPPYYNRVEEDEQMEKLLNELMLLCLENELDFEIGLKGGLVEVRGDSEAGLFSVAKGYIKDWEYETPTDVLTRVIKETESYVRWDKNE